MVSIFGITTCASNPQILLNISMLVHPTRFTVDEPSYTSDPPSTNVEIEPVLERQAGLSKLYEFSRVILMPHFRLLRKREESRVISDTKWHCFRFYHPDEP